MEKFHEIFSTNPFQPFYYNFRTLIIKIIQKPFDLSLTKSIFLDKYQDQSVFAHCQFNNGNDPSLYLSNFQSTPELVDFNIYLPYIKVTSGDIPIKILANQLTLINSNDNYYSKVLSLNLYSSLLTITGNFDISLFSIQTKSFSVVSTNLENTMVIVEQLELNVLEIVEFFSEFTFKEMNVMNYLIQVKKFIEYLLS